MPPPPPPNFLWACVLSLADDRCGETGLAINELITHNFNAPIDQHIALLDISWQ